MSSHNGYTSEIVAHARGLMDRIFDAVQTVHPGNQRAEQIRRLLWQHAIEDGDAVQLLLRVRRYASARALLRPQLESLARAYWAKFLATHEELNRFADGANDPPSISMIMRCLGDAGIDDPNVLATRELWRDRGSAFHDTTHRGTRALARLAIANNAEDDYVPDDALPLLYISLICAGVAATSMLIDDSREEAARTLSRELEAFMHHAHQLV